MLGSRARLIHASNATAGLKVRAVGHIKAGYTN